MLQHRDYTVGWICALYTELSTARAMLDEIHPRLPQPSTDHNSYTLGRIGGHNVVIAVLPMGGIGAVPAAIAAVQMRLLFKEIQFALLVGIGGGAPSTDHDIRLGDVVVSKPEDGHGGVVQYDFGKHFPGGFRRTGALNRPPDIIMAALNTLMSERDFSGNNIAEYMKPISKMRNASKYQHPQQYDQLYSATYDHVDQDTGSCDRCDSSKLIHRADRGSPTNVEVFYGTIASANQVMRSGVERKRLTDELGVMCFEMEAAGLMNDFPCVVIRGICDYADSHKNKQWQGYAAATAAAFAKELLSFITPAQVGELLLSNHMHLGLMNDNGKGIPQDHTKRNSVIQPSSTSNTISSLPPELAPVATPISELSPQPSTVLRDSGSNASLNQLQAHVIYDFDASGPPELSVRAGDVVVIVEPDDGSGWVACQLKGSQPGLIPASYIEIEQFYEAPSKAPSVQQVRAMYDHDAQSNLELSIRQGDVIVLTSTDCSAGWWKALCEE